MAGFGEDDRYRTMFESSNRLRFVVEIGEDDKAWWLSSIYDPFRLTPEEVGDRLSASWAGDKLMQVTELNGCSGVSRCQSPVSSVPGRRGSLKGHSIFKALS
jgi:hypothetical protein